MYPPRETIPNANNARNETMMMVRLCLPAGLLSQLLSLALADNDIPQCQLSITRYLSLPTCEIRLELNDTSILQWYLPSWYYSGTSYWRSGNMSSRQDLRPGFGGPRLISSGFDELKSSVHEGDFLRLDEDAFFELLHRAYSTELDYLKTAYVAPVRSNPRIHSRAPSEKLFGKRYGEVDRTMTGLNALRWIHQNDHASYTSNQPSSNKLTRKTFEEMRDLFLRYTSTQELLTLIMMQMTNDVGKSTDLRHLYYESNSRDDGFSVNHDMMMYLAVRDRPELVPSFQQLPDAEMKLVQELLCVSAEFNPAQLIQAECPPEVMSILQEQSWTDDTIPAAVDRKFLELFLDLSGALGQIDHEGAMTMTEPVVRSLLHALNISKLVAARRLTTEEAYYEVLEHRLHFLEEIGWTGKLNVRNNDADLAKARIFCMGRVDSIEKANLFEDVIDSLPQDVKDGLAWGLRIDHTIARQATYMPGMIANINTPEQLCALLGYLARVLFISDEDLTNTPRKKDGTLATDLVIVERDVMSIIKPLLKTKDFEERPMNIINDSTPLPPLQILKRSSERHVPLVGDKPT